MYLITVIIPIYNCESEIGAAIESVIHQTIGFENIELYIVDDASTDRSAEIARSYEKQYQNIQLICLPENSGYPGKPRNIGLKYASAKYIVFLDADDKYEKDALRILFEAIENTKSDYIIANHITDFGSGIMKNILFPDDGDITTVNLSEDKDKFDQLLIKDQSWAKIFRREMIEKNNIFFLEDSLYEDTYFIVKLLLCSKTVTVLNNEYVYVYNSTEMRKTAIHGHDRNTYESFFKGLRKTKELLEEKNVRNEFFLSEGITRLLLIFSNLKHREKKELIIQLYSFENGLNLKIYKKEIVFLNWLIRKKKFKSAIIISDFYSFLYSNRTIRNVYRRINNKYRRSQ